ncbi:MAG: hypothetical protein ACLP1X_31895 [Polyangiaceae bacterium]
MGSPVPPFRLQDLVPWRELTIETKWSPEVVAIEIRKRLAARGPRPLFAFGFGGPSPDRLFVGRSDGTHFVFSRAIGYRNSFLPVIAVSIDPSGDEGARLRVRMRLNALVIAFMGVWLAGATIGSLSIAALGLYEGNPTALVGLLFPLFGGGLMSGGFAYEARRAEALLRGIFPPPALEPAGPYR